MYNDELQLHLDSNDCNWVHYNYMYQYICCQAMTVCNGDVFTTFTGNEWTRVSGVNTSIMLWRKLPSTNNELCCKFFFIIYTQVIQRALHVPMFDAISCNVIDTIIKKIYLHLSIYRFSVANVINLLPVLSTGIVFHLSSSWL